MYIIALFIVIVCFTVREFNQIKLLKEIIGDQDWIERIKIRWLLGFPYCGVSARMPRWKLRIHSGQNEFQHY